MGRLTVTAIRKLEPGKHSDGLGLYLFVDKRGVDYARWVFIYTLKGRRPELSLGPYHAVPLAEARALAAQARELVRRGVDPVSDRKAAQKVGEGATFGDAADEWLEQKLTALRNAKSQAMLRRDVSVTMLPLRKLQVADVTVDDVLRLLAPIWKKSPDAGRRLRQKIEAILDAASAKGLRRGENPARWRGHLQHLLAKPPKVEKPHLAAMPYADVPQFIANLRQADSVSARALEFCVLTAARTGEVIGARWDEIDIENKTWALPANRMKAGRAHTVPLPHAAILILERMAQFRRDEYVFPSRKAGKPLTHDGLALALKRQGVTDYTVHGFRSSFRDWCGNETQFPREVAEAALAHAVGDEVERAYRRSDALDKRRRLMDQWAAFLAPTTQISE